jgi:hypothetical protein
MNEIIEKIKEKLEKYPQVKKNIGKNYLIIYPETKNGFQVRIDVGTSKYTVSFNGWHEEFSNPEKALNCFAFGLSEECRLKVHTRGNFEYKWEVESQKENQWVSDSETGLIFSPFWRKKKIKYLQNSIIKNL